MILCDTLKRDTSIQCVSTYTKDWKASKNLHTPAAMSFLIENLLKSDDVDEEEQTAGSEKKKSSSDTRRQSRDEESFTVKQNINSRLKSDGTYEILGRRVMVKDSPMTS